MSYKDYQAVIWSGVEVRLLRALWEITAEDGGIPVRLGYEPDNPADAKAVMITISTYTLRRLLGADQVSVPAGDDGTEPQTQFWRLGYIRRGDSGKDTLQRALTERDSLLDAKLVLDKHDWLVRALEPVDPDAPDSDIPF
jgi:hypothetical protein